MVALKKNKNQKKRTSDTIINMFSTKKIYIHNYITYILIIIAITCVYTLPMNFSATVGKSIGS